jgi:two-component system chemotaxis response regulator CheB
MSPPGTVRDLVVIGASAGGVEALRVLVAGLPVDLAAAILIVLHLPPHGTSALAGILDAAGRLPAGPAEDGAKIQPGHLYVAPPDHHLLVDETGMLLADGPPENGHRPAINALFRSAARARGPAVAGIVLSGVLDDGTAGLVAIKACGGLTIVQDPDDAAYRNMPESALNNVQVDYVLPAAEIGVQLGQLLRGSPDAGSRSWSADGLLSTADDATEAALWTAVRTLDEKATLSRRMAVSAGQRGNQELARRYADAAEETGNAARLLRSRLTKGQSDSRQPGSTGSSDEAT